MAAKGSLNFVELHLEKGLLGLGVVFMIGLGVYFLGLDPNKVEFSGQKVGPRELDEAVLRQAEQLQKAVHDRKPEEPNVPTFAEKLQQQFDDGIFGTDDSGPALPRDLRVAAQFNPIPPLLDEKQDTDRDIVVVTPLKPSSLAVETGISLVTRRQLTLGGAETPATPPADEDDAPTELSWVTVGAYFPQEAEQREMTKAGYAGYRAKVFVVGSDLQRQEMTASGDYSDWVDVEPSKAMPKFDLPAPAYDAKSGELVNQRQLDEALELVKVNQATIMQAPFYPVQAGDLWSPPPLPGHEPVVEETTDETPVKPSVPKPPNARPQPPPVNTGGRGRGGGGLPPPAPVGGGGRGRGGMPGPAPTPGRGGGPPPTVTPPPKPSNDVKDNLAKARKAREHKEWDEAIRLAGAVAGSAEATPSEKSAAERIVKEAQAAIERDKVKDQLRQHDTFEFVRNPGKEGEPAIWFHDDSVQPGKTYRYRMRVKIWNRYVGRQAAVRDPNDADRSVLEGEWSLPSLPITVAPKRHFFVRGPVFGEPAASIDVFTWHKGKWLKEDFKVKVGDAIGAPVDVRMAETDKDAKPTKEKVDFATNAIVLDLRVDEPVLFRRATGKAGEFAYRDTKSLVLTYLDPADGQVKERVSDVDKGDPLYKKLKDEWESSRGG